MWNLGNPGLGEHRQLAHHPALSRAIRTPDFPHTGLAPRRAPDRCAQAHPVSGLVGCIHLFLAHFEHFPYDESLAVAKECFRVLRPGGILRIVVPDLGIAVREYLADTADPKASHRFIGRLLLTGSVRDFLHPGAHHQQMFDARSLVHMLREAGFSAPTVSEFGSRRLPEIDSNRA
ncbi:MAG: hypothetical protein WAQ52_06610 [Terriglobales bacterium]